jgi:hypothetical protein
LIQHLKETAMRTSIALSTICALAVIALGSGLGPVNRDSPTTPAAPLAIVAPETAAVDAPDQAPRRHALKVLPTVTVVPEPADLAALDATEDARGSVVLGAAVDQATQALARPIGGSLPRARLGNPFYDFGRTRGTPAATE